jgi:hypothetical protein
MTPQGYPQGVDRKPDYLVTFTGSNSVAGWLSTGLGVGYGLGPEEQTAWNFLIG